MSDIFADAHRADARAAEKKKVTDAKTAAKEVSAQKLLDRMKQPFNDIPPYKFKDVFKFGGPR